MKRLMIIMLLLLATVSFGQTNYYSQNNGLAISSESQVKEIYETILKTLPKRESLTPTIFHRIVKKDSIVNFYAFMVQNADKKDQKSKFEFEFKQDSLYLLLNKKLPEFKLMDLDGKLFSSSKLIGKPTLLNYWAIYCRPCVAEFPQLDALKTKYGTQMNFVAIAEDTCPGDTLKSFLKKHPFHFFMLKNGERYKKTLKIGAIPRNIFIDKDGYIRYIQGNFPYDALNMETGERKYADNNYFVKIIEELIGSNK